MRKLCLVLIVGVLLVPAAAAASGSVAAAAVPDGPRLALARFSLDFRQFLQAAPSNRAQFSDVLKEEVFTTDAFGGAHQILIGDSQHRGYFSLTTGDLGWSPDGSTLAVQAATVSGLRDSAESDTGDIYLIGADGTGLRQLTQVGNATAPVFSADGKVVYFQRLKIKAPEGIAQAKNLEQLKHLMFRPPSSSIWAVNVDGTGLRRVTPPSRHIFETPTSVSPLTGDLALSRKACKKGKCTNSAVLFSPATGDETVLLEGAYSPVFSPDGKKMALGSYRDRNFGKHRHIPAAELYVLDLGTGALQRLTYSPGIDEYSPSWDPSGSRLAYLRGSFAGFDVREINTDGSCVTPIAEPHGIFTKVYTGLAWQPGAGRGAGPIAC